MKNKKDCKLWELEKGTLVRMGTHVMEFMGVDGMYCRWKFTDGKNKGEIVIVGNANQKVTEYGEII